MFPHPTEPKPTLHSLSPQQWKSGIAAWLGWMFDGLELHLYTLVALPFVALLWGGGGDGGVDRLERAEGVGGAEITLCKKCERE